MSLVLAYDQFNGSTLTLGTANLPAGAALLRAKLETYTAFSSSISPPGFQFAPPNTILGIWWVAHGTIPPTITTSNWKNGTWIVAGHGILKAYDRWTYNDLTNVPNTTYVQEVFNQYVEIEFPFVSAAAMDIGISLNFEGGGFWSNVQPWLTYQFEAYFD